MENEKETYRLDVKKDSKVVKKQALWAGIKPGMYVAAVCCGSGRTTSMLHKLVQPSGIAVGLDGSEKRIEYAKEHYGVKDIRKPLGDLGFYL